MSTQPSGAADAAAGPRGRRPSPARAQASAQEPARASAAERSGGASDGVAAGGRGRQPRARDARRELLREARTKLHEIAALLDRAGGRSPFAPERFPDIRPIEGVSLSAAAAAVRYEDRLDVMLARIEGPAPAAAGVFTRSGAKAAPVIWCEDVLRAVQSAPADAAPARAKKGARKAAAPHGFGLLVNAGNANAFTGDHGRQGVKTTAAAAAKALGQTADRIFVASTGVIGEPLPAERITAKLGELAGGLAPDAWEPAAQAIMTTDTYPKAASAEIEIDGARVRLSGIAKGSGMIAPDMATMLAFVFTDAVVAPPLLQRMLSELTETTFNAVTVDGDTSTSDTLLLFATGAAGNSVLESARSPGYTAFRRALERVLRSLALSVVKDGEGCSKFIEVRVEGAKSRRSARTIGRAIANSPLVKTAWAGEDPNWGRIVMAVGKSGEPADRDKLAIRYGQHPVAEKGWRAEDYDEATLAAYMRQPEISVTVDVGVGAAAASVWTCDLTHGYISINADYRS